MFVVLYLVEGFREIICPAQIQFGLEISKTGVREDIEEKWLQQVRKVKTGPQLRTIMAVGNDNHSAPTRGRKQTLCLLEKEIEWVYMTRLVSIPWLWVLSGCTNRHSGKVFLRN